MRVVLKADIVREKAAQRNLSLEEVAHASRMHPTHLYKVLSGRYSRQMTPAKRRALLEALGASFDDIFELIQDGAPATVAS
jgi:transcriptional regulator with XRE-family HTH domain